MSVPNSSYIAQIEKRPTSLKIFSIRKSPGSETINKYVLPIQGKGLWSTLKGYLAVDANGQTIRGISYYEHAETPGLGGEVDNEGWKASWSGKELYDEAGELAIEVTKGKAQNVNQVDGLSGATITSNGVTNMLQYWLGDDAFGKFIEELKTDSSQQGDNNG